MINQVVVRNSWTNATHVASIITTSGHSLLLGTNNSERLRITSNGSIGTKGLVPTDGSFVANSSKEVKIPPVI